MNVGKIMPFAELSQPAGDAVRVHHGAIVMGKDEVRTDPVITIENAEPKLFCVLFIKQFQTLRCKHHSPGLKCQTFTLRVG